MKHFVIFSFFSLLCFNNAEAQTNANIAGPENVLVVYKQPNTPNDTLGLVSDSVKTYYQNSREIPESNIVPLSLPDSIDITIDDITHWVGLRQETDLIQDIYNHSINTWYATEHAWKYFYQYVAAPIKEHITSNNLTDIRYIVLVKGMPFKIQAALWNGSPLCNVTTAGLLCMLNTDNYEDFLHSVYTDFRSRALPPPNYNYRPIYGLSNPYYNADPNFTMDYRFSPGEYTRNWNGYTVKLDYLVSHIDGLSYDIVEGIIDKSVNADKSGTATWVLDDDPTLGFGHNYFSTTKSTLETYGFDVTDDYSNTWITSSPKNVMGYFSWGTHAEDGNCNFQDSAWIKDSLKFNLANGAIFNALESFNGYSLTTLKWRFNEQPNCSGHTMGLSTQFTEIGGTGTMAHAQEPIVSPYFGINDTRKIFPAYAMGYSIVDAMYQGIYYLAWVNVVVGDPLTTIAWGKQTVTQDLTWGGTNLVTGEISVPLENSISLEDGAVVNFRHNGFITGDGYVLPETHSFTLNINDWEKAVFRSTDNNHPRIIWGAYPGLPALMEGYKIYRKWESANFVLIGQVDASTFEYLDEDVEIYVPINENPKEAEYYITAIIEDQSGSVESDPSNIIDYWVYKAGKIHIAKNETEITYNLDQNYPNPFNPLTIINYQIPNDGMVILKVYDILGSEVATLVNELKTAGRHAVNFDASSLVSGVYLYKINAGSFVQTRKMILLK